MIASGYDRVDAHVSILSKKKRPVAEIDLVATKGSRCDVFEVKCSHRITKARKQLTKIKKLMNKLETYRTVNAYFYCGESGALISI